MEVPGIPNARYWVDADLEPFIRDAFAAGQREQVYLARTGRQGALPPAIFLAVSGGGWWAGLPLAKDSARVDGRQESITGNSE